VVSEFRGRLLAGSAEELLFTTMLDLLREQRAYARRSGVEGVLSQGVRVCDLRRSRYIGMAKTRLQNLIIATAINLIPAVAWLMEVPRAGTRQSAFAALGAGQGRQFGWSGAG